MEEILFQNEINDTKIIKVANEMASQMPTSHRNENETTPEMKHSPITDWNSLPWVCYLCEESFNGLKNLSTHQESLHKDRNKEEDHFICFNCNETLSEYSIFLNHIRRRHYNSLKLCCDVCNKVLPNYAQLAEHREEHIEYTNEIHPNVYHCSSCDEVAATEKILKLHIQEYHDLNPGDATQQNDPSDVFVIEEFKYECPDDIEDESDVEDCVKCEEKYNDTEELFQASFKRHMETHNNERQFKCEVCSKTCTTKGNLKIHMETHNNERPFKCEVCCKMFKTRIVLGRHMLVHSDQFSYKCGICSKAFKSDRYLKRHMAIHNDERTYKCDVCSKTFSFKVHLTNHMVTHNSERTFKCDVCSKSFKNKRILVAHMVVHSDQFSFKCGICSKAFKRHYTLTTHMETHKPTRETHERPFKCDVCSKTFTKKDCLRQHMPTHNSERPFNCDVCSKPFKMKIHLKRHMTRRHAPPSSFKCGICSKVLKSPLYLKQQLRAGLKEIVVLGGNNNSSKTQSNETNFISNNELAWLALQSLANAAERQAPGPQPPTASDLQQQFLLHMAANPMIKSSNEFFQRQQQHQQQMLLSPRQLGLRPGTDPDSPQVKDCHSSATWTQPLQQQQQQMLEQQQQHQEIRQREEEIELLIDQNDQKSEPDLMLVDESLGLEYKSPEGIDERTDTTHLTTTSADHQSGGELVSINSTSNDNGGGGGSGGGSGGGGNSSKPGRSVQRRRVRRKAQSSMDDQAEHLTEMSVRGLDLFRYACITEGVYQCTECAKENVQKTFKNKYSFQRHAFLYHEGKHRKVFPCPLCSKEFSRPDKMKNHMKMTHESFVSSKEITNFNPLNYLITAAAAGEMHATLLTHQQQAQQQQQQLDQLEHMSEQQQQQQQQYNNALAALSVSLEAQHTTIENVVASARNENENIAPPPSSASEMDISAAALLKLQNDIVIKNEIVISPSPSPPPIEISATPSTPNIKAVNNQQSPTQRLEEVK